MSQNVLETCIQNFIEDRKFRGLSPRTIKYYQGELNLFQKWINDNVGLNVEIQNINANILKKYFLHKSKTRNKGGVYACYTSVRALFRFTEIDLELEWKNPISKVKLPNPKPEILEEIPLQHVRKLLETNYGRNQQRNILVIMLLIDGGFRSSEVLDLRIGDCNLETGQIIIQHGKGNKKRFIFVGQKTKKLLKEYIDTLEDNPDCLLFESERKQKLSYRGLRHMIHGLCRAAKIPLWPLHAFRRSFALNLWRATKNLILVQTSLGHSSPIVTTRYLNISPVDLQENYVSPIDGLA